MGCGPSSDSGVMGSVPEDLDATPNEVYIPKSPQEMLEFAIKNSGGSKDKLQMALEKYISGGGDVNTKIQSEKFGPLNPVHVATRAGSDKAVSLLLKAGAEVDAKDAREQTSLHLACGGGHLEIVELLLSANANVNARSSNGSTPLKFCIESTNSNPKILMLLLENNAAVDDDQYDPPLVIAAKADNVAAMKVLLENNARAGGLMVPLGDETVDLLTWATQNNYEELVAMLGDERQGGDGQEDNNPPTEEKGEEKTDADGSSNKEENGDGDAPADDDGNEGAGEGDGDGAGESGEGDGGGDGGE